MTAAFLGELYATMSVNTADIDRAATRMKRFEMEANASLQNVSRSFNVAGGAMKTFGRQLSQYVTLPMTLVGGAAIKMYRDFEFSMNKVVSLVGVARSQVDQWTKQVLALAPAVGKSPRELADAMYFITSAGIRGAEAMQILEESAKSSAGGLGEVKVVADLLTSAMNAYGKENLSAAQANDVLVATVREGKAEADLLAQSMGLVLPIASAMGSTFDQVGAATAAMTRTGTKAATAAIQLRQIFNSLLKPAKEAEQALQDMGTSGAELRRTIREDGLMATIKKLKDLVEKYGIEALGRVIPNIRSLTGVLDIAGANWEENVKLTEAIKNSMGDAAKMFEETEMTIRQRLNVALAKLQVAGTKLGESISTVLIPILEKLAGFVEKLIDWFQGLSKAQQKAIIVIGALVAALGPISIILGVMVSTIGAMLTPLGLVITGITLAVGAFTGFAIAASRTNKELMTHKQYLEELGGTRQQYLQDVAKEEAHLWSLFGILKKLNGDTQVRRDLIKTINTEYGDYLPNLLTEKSTLNDIKTAETELLGIIRAKAAARAKEMKMAAILEAQLEREMEIMKVYKTQEAPLSSWMYAFEEYVAGAGQVDKYTIDLAGSMTKTKAKWVKEVEALATATTWSFDEIVEIFGRWGKAREQDEETMDQYGAYYDKWIKDLVFSTEKGTNEIIEAIEGVLPAQQVRAQLEQQLKGFENLAKIGGWTYDLLKEKASAYQQALDAMAQLVEKPTYEMRKWQREIKAVEMQMDSLKNSLIDATIELQKMLALSAYKGSIFPDFNAEKAQLEAYGNYMEGLFTRRQELLNRQIEPTKTGGLESSYLVWGDMSSGADKYHTELMRVEELITTIGKKMQELRSEADKVSTGTAWTELASTISGIDKAVEKGLLSPLDGARDKASLFEKFYKQAISGAFQGTPTEISNFFKYIEEGWEGVNDTITKTKFWEDMYQGFAVAAREIAGLFGDLQGLWQTQMQNEIAAMEASAQAKGKSEKWLADEREKIQKKYNKKIQTAAIAQAVVNQALAIANVWKTWSDNPVVAAILSGIAAAAVGVQIAAIKAQKMAGGGIVPPGYPRDTYPALLTSGEEVIPANRRRSERMDGEVVFRIEGDQLMGILKKRESVMQNY